ncbi:MAG: CPBP family intramembrane glutamic endopeptidase [Rhizomicrobium sp.]
MADQLAQEPAHRDGRVRWYDLLIAFFGGTLAGIVLTALVGLVGVLIAMRYGFRPTVASLTTFLRTSFATNMATIVLSDGGLLAVVWLVARRRFAHPTAQFFAPVRSSAVVWAILSGLGLSLLLNGGNELLERVLHVRFEETDIERVLEPHGAGQFAVALAVVALFAPFIEEYFFRGVFLAWARHATGAWAGTVITALGFALAHGHLFVHPGTQGLVFTAELFAAGVILAQWVVRTGSLRTSFAAHAAYNATAILFSVFYP